jgi:hypothetical protein
MHETEPLEDIKSLEGVEAARITWRLQQLYAHMRDNPDVIAAGPQATDAIVKKCRHILERWLADNQQAQLDLHMLRTLVGRLNTFCERHGSRYGRDSHWSELEDIRQKLNIYVGCLHPWQGVEAGEDEDGLFVICSKCGHTSHDLSNWKPPKKD